jgi:hypothetical protein
MDFPAEKLACKSVPQRLKPNSFQSSMDGLKAVPFNRNEFFRSL